MLELNQVFQNPTIKEYKMRAISLFLILVLAPVFAFAETLQTLEIINSSNLVNINKNFVTSPGSYKLDEDANPIALCYNTKINGVLKRRKLDFSSSSIPYPSIDCTAADTEDSLVTRPFGTYTANYLGWAVTATQYKQNLASIRSAANLKFQYVDGTRVDGSTKKVTRWVFNSNKLPPFIKNADIPGAGYAIHIGKNVLQSLQIPFFSTGSSALRFSANLDIPTYKIVRKHLNKLPTFTEGFPSITVGFAIGIFAKTKGTTTYRNGVRAIEFMVGLLPASQEYIGNDTRNIFVGSLIKNNSLWNTAKLPNYSFSLNSVGDSKTLSTNGYKTYMFDITRENLRAALVAANAKITVEDEKFDTEVVGGVDPLSRALFKGITLRSENRFMYAGSALFELKLDYIKVDRVLP